MLDFVWPEKCPTTSLIDKFKRHKLSDKNNFV
jgi:hypothetical protein